MKNEKKLTVNAQMELQKTRAICESELVKELSLNRENKSLRQDIVLRDDLIKDKKKPDSKLTDRIEEKQAILDDIVAEIYSNQTEIYVSLDAAKLAISELRKVNPKKANELENSLNIKVEAKKENTITKKRL